jgi:hypothetical protein
VRGIVDYWLLLSKRKLTVLVAMCFFVCLSILTTGKEREKHEVPSHDEEEQNNGIFLSSQSL